MKHFLFLCNTRSIVKNPLPITKPSKLLQVAKATYATLALLFIFYRMRRGSKSSSELASGKCSCESDQDPSVNSDIGAYGVDPDCSVCRERSERAMTEYDREQQRRSAGEDDGGCRDDPPPPPPPPASGASGSAPRRKCPCEEQQRRAEGSVKHSSNSNSSSSSSRARNQQIQPPYQYHQYTQPEPEQVRPASQVMGQVHDAFYRVLRGVVGAVLGNAAVNTAGPVPPPKPRLRQSELQSLRMSWRMTSATTVRTTRTAMSRR